MDNCQFTSRRGCGILSSPNQTSPFIYSSGALVGPRDGDPNGCTGFSCHSKLEHCFGLGLKANRSSLPWIWNLISVAPTSMCAFVVLWKGLLRMRGVFMSSCISSTKNPLEQRSFLFLPEYSRRFRQDSEPVGQLVAGTLMLA